MSKRRGKVTNPIFLLIRTWTGYIQCEFSQKCGISKTIISNYEHSKYYPTPEYQEKIVDVCQINSSWLNVLLSSSSTEEEKEQNLFLIFQKMKGSKSPNQELGMILAMLRTQIELNPTNMAYRIQHVDFTPKRWTSTMICDIEHGNVIVKEEDINLYCSFFDIPKQKLLNWENINSDEEKQKLLYELYKIARRKRATFI